MACALPSFASFLGIAAAFGFTRFISSFLFGVKAWDPLVFVTVPVLLSLIALLAVWMPATHASRLEPPGGPAHRVTALNALGNWRRVFAKVGRGDVGL